MKKISNNKLEDIVGGTNYVSGTVINAFVNVIKLVMEAGEQMGSSIRRIAEGNICPLN